MTYKDRRYMINAEMRRAAQTIGQFVLKCIHGFALGSFLLGMAATHSGCTMVLGAD